MKLYKSSNNRIFSFNRNSLKVGILYAAVQKALAQQIP